MTIFSAWIPQSKNAALKVLMQNSEAFNSYGQTAFQKNLKNLHAHQQHMTVSLSMPFCQHWEYNFFHLVFNTRSLKLDLSWN